MNIKPLGEKVIIRPISAEQKTVGGIVLPDTAKEKPQQGEVLAIGPGRILDNGTRVPLEVKVGDKVMFSKYAAVDIKVDDEDLILLNERDIHAIL